MEVVVNLAVFALFVVALVILISPDEIKIGIGRMWLWIKRRSPKV